jgi:hypothetical protein
MSTQLFEGNNVQVTRFACGRCRTDGPCFQITGIGGGAGDYVIVHREDAQSVAKALAEEVGLILSDPDPCG